MSLSVVLAGGGTTGHVAPLLALADCLVRRDPGTRITVLGTSEGLEAQLVPAAGYELRFVPRVPLPRRPTVDLLALPGKLGGAVGAAAATIRDVDADVVVGFGGYVASPAYLAAKRARVPIVVHESNARPGIANRLGARLTDHVGISFPGTPLPGATLVGMPLRRSITNLDRGALRAEALAAFGLEPGRRTLLVFGGSIGAQRLNLSFGAAAPALARAGVQVLHSTGRGKQVGFPDGFDPAGPPAYREVEYLDRMDLAYAAADLAACRAGAGTVSELSAIGLPAAYVPLPVGNGEQRLNAQPVVDAGGGLVVDDAACTPDWVASSVVPLVADAARLAAMGAAVAAFGIRDADERLADLVELATGRAGAGVAGGGAA